MKIIILANHAAILPAIDCFHAQGWLNAVISTEKLHSNNLQIEDLSRQRGIPFYKITEQELKTSTLDLFKQIKPDVVFMCGFTYRIPQELFSIPASGFFNIHFSMLPAYRGPDPVFWQIRNGEQTGGISIHKVEASFDSGDVVARQEIPFIQGENWGICDGRYSAAVFNTLIPLINKIIQGEQILPLNPLTVSESYFSKPAVQDFIIQWETSTAAEIENLVNACNPLAGGALTFLNNQPVRILETGTVYTQDEIPEAAPGTIILSDAHNGIMVLCAGKSILRINIIKLNEGYFTGLKLFAMGVKAGDRFETNLLNQQAIIN